METVGVSEEVKESLAQMKKWDGHTSYDSVVRELILYRKLGKDSMDDMKEWAIVEKKDWESIIKEASPNPPLKVEPEAETELEEEAEFETESELEREDR